MAVRHRLIARPPAAVWDVLSDPYRYAAWVVGTRESTPVEGDWPEVGSALAYTVRIGRTDLHGRTWVRRYEPPRILELEAYSGPLGTARIALDVRPWGDETLVIMDEHPLRGFGGRVHNRLLDAMQQLRHRGMLNRLARLVVDVEPAPDAGGPGS
ncbi:SRPBCC family protein [Streptomyces sp. NBRC 109706]|uniref:SRPBCC family protein n=1 Tax=Streptomyces sp. NBRC 109706 TaxID=1550035 RepID=UPI0007819CD8|nr:SRPBCC family protein [Streptomyces sp. NBRC 109706]